MEQNLTFSREDLKNSFSKAFDIKNVSLDDRKEAMDIIKRLIYKLGLYQTLRVMGATILDHGKLVKVEFWQNSDYKMTEMEFVDGLKKLNDYIHKE